MSVRKTINRTIAQDAGWEEGKHHRGQPGNKGEFASSGSSGESKKPFEGGKASSAESFNAGNIGRAKQAAATAGRKPVDYTEHNKKLFEKLPKNEQERLRKVDAQPVTKTEHGLTKAFTDLAKSLQPKSAGGEKPTPYFTPGATRTKSEREQMEKRQKVGENFNKGGVWPPEGVGSGEKSDPDHSKLGVAPSPTPKAGLKGPFDIPPGGKSNNKPDGTPNPLPENEVGAAPTATDPDSPENEEARQRVMQDNLEGHRIGWEATFGKGGKNTHGETLEQFVASMHPKRFDYVGAEAAQKEQHNTITHEMDGTKRSLSSQKWITGKDAQPGMVTQPNSGGPAYKGRNLDNDPVGDRSVPAPDCSGGAGWPGRVL